MKRKLAVENEEGQVIVEFVIVFSMIATLIFLFVQMSWGIAWGHYTHYATFMAARAYMASAPTQGDQFEAAGAVLRSTLKVGGKDIFPFLAPARPGGDRPAVVRCCPASDPGARQSHAPHRHRSDSWFESLSLHEGSNGMRCPGTVGLDASLRATHGRGGLCHIQFLPVTQQECFTLTCWKSLDGLLN